MCLLCHDIYGTSEITLSGNVDTCRRLYASGLVSVSNVFDEHGDPIHIVAQAVLKTMNCCCWCRCTRCHRG